MTTEPTTPRILDLDAMELDDGKPPFEFRFGGETYTCQSPNGYDVRDMSDLIADEDPAMVLVMMLGEEQYERLEAAEATFTLAHFEKVGEAYFDHYGLSAGKSNRSQRRSKTHQRR